MPPRLPDVPTQIPNVGIVLVAVPSTKPGFSIEIQRTSDDGTGTAASTGAVSIAELPPAQTGGAMFVDHLPDDGAKRFYRGRHVAGGYAPSVNWTAWTTGHRPLMHTIEDMLTMEQTAIWPVSREWLPVTSGTVEKVLQIPAADFQPGTQGIGYVLGVAGIAPTTSGSHGFYAPVSLAPGVTITGLRQFGYVESTQGGSVISTLNWVPSSDPAGSSGFVTATQTSSGYQTTTGAAFPTHLVGTSSEWYVIQAILTPTSSGAPFDTVKLSRCDVIYTVPTYEKTL